MSIEEIIQDIRDGRMSGKIIVADYATAEPINLALKALEAFAKVEKSIDEWRGTDGK